MLAALIKRQRQCLDELLELLRREQSLLLSPTPDGLALSELAATKQLALNELEQLEAQRVAAQQAAGCGQDMPGAARAAISAGCAGDWQSLRDKATLAGSFNQLNGELVHHRMHVNQRFLNALHESRGNTTYGPDGLPGSAGARINSRA